MKAIAFYNYKKILLMSLILSIELNMGLVTSVNTMANQ